MRKLLVAAMVLLMATVFSGCDESANSANPKSGYVGKYIGEIHHRGIKPILVYEHEGNWVYVYTGNGICVVPKGAAR